MTAMKAGMLKSLLKEFPDGEDLIIRIHASGLVELTTKTAPYYIKIKEADTPALTDEALHGGT